MGNKRFRTSGNKQKLTNEAATAENDRVSNIVARAETKECEAANAENKRETKHVG